MNTRPNRLIALSVTTLFSAIIASSTWYVTKELNDWAIGLFVVSVGAAIALIITEWPRWTEISKSRLVRYEMRANLIIILVALLAVGLYLTATRHEKQWDLTQANRFELSEQTRSVLTSLTDELSITALIKQGAPEQGALDDLLTAFGQHGELKVEIIDPIRQPKKTLQMTQASGGEAASEYGTLLLSYNDRQERIDGDFSETAMTNAMIRLVSGKEHQLCWSVGHGEADPDDEFGREGLGAMVLILEAKNYIFSKQRILTEGIDAECEALLIVGPAQDFTVEEAATLEAYLQGGGSVFLLLNPHELSNLANVLLSHGAKLQNDIVYEQSAYNLAIDAQEAAYLVYYEDHLAPHPITESLGGNIMLRFPVRSVQPVADLLEHTTLTLITASDQSWAETSLEQEAEPSEGDIIGDVPLMTVTEFESEEKQGRLVVIGDVSFATNELMAQGSNQTLFLNTIAWMTGENAQLGAPPDLGEPQLLDMTVVDEALLWLVSVILLPGLAFLGALITLLRKRQR